MVIARSSPIPEVIYKVNAYYSPEHYRGLVWSDPALGIAWPVSVNEALVSDKDRTHPVLSYLPRYFLRDRVTALKANLDPVRLLVEIRAAQQRLVALADKPMTGDAPAPTLEVFLAGLRTAWKEGEVRPTAQPTVKAVRWWRSRRDPFETTWPLLRQWFDAEPERTGRELFERLQAQHPGVYPDGQLRTLQRRLKGWRREAARRLVFATSTVEPGFATGAEVPYGAAE